MDTTAELAKELANLHRPTQTDITTAQPPKERPKRETTAELFKDLANLHRLTQTEIMIAETRRAQATTEDFERELRQNADKARERLQLLDDAIRNLGGTPDYVGS